MSGVDHSGDQRQPVPETVADPSSFEDHLRSLGTISFVLLVLIAIGPILLLSLLMSRVPQIRWVTALIMTGLTAVAVTLIFLLPRGGREVLLACLVLALATVVCSRVAERRRLGPNRQTRAAVPSYLLAGWLFVVLCSLTMLWRPAPFYPAADTVLPLPDGLQATVNPVEDGDCGSGLCTRTITVTGRPGQTGQDLYAEMRRHLQARGWGAGCRPVGWLLDRASECVEVTPADGQVTIALSGSRDDLRHLVTIG
jgi:hypothetical protein